MTEHANSDKYIKVEDAFTNEFYCPLSVVAPGVAGDDFDFTDCVDSGVVERYAGSIAFETEV